MTSKQIRQEEEQWTKQKRKLCITVQNFITGRLESLETRLKETESSLMALKDAVARKAIEDEKAAEAAKAKALEDEKVSDQQEPSSCAFYLKDALQWDDSALALSRLPDDVLQERLAALVAPFSSEALEPEPVKSVGKNPTENVTANVARPAARPVSNRKKQTTENVTANVARPVARPMTATVRKRVTRPPAGPVLRSAAAVPEPRGTKRPFEMVSCDSSWSSRLRPRRERCMVR